jgi:hypothetical protein
MKLFIPVCHSNKQHDIKIFVTNHSERYNDPRRTQKQDTMEKRQQAKD